MNNVEKKLIIFDGTNHVDDRGTLIFSNNLDISHFKRQYFVSNFSSQFIRAWHGHKIESKAVSVISGAAIICAVEIDNWENPSKALKINRLILSSENPKWVLIPNGYANGFKTLKKNTVLQFLSTHSTSDSLNDDFRFEYNYWNPWEIVQR